MTTKEEFLDWLEDQGYWVNSETVKEKFPDLEFKESPGITVKQNSEGDVMVPKRDLRKGLKV